MEGEPPGGPAQVGSGYRNHGGSEHMEKDNAEPLFAVSPR